MAVQFENAGMNRAAATTRPLRRYFYSTILFVCLATALISMKASKQNGIGNVSLSQNLPKESELLTRIRRQSNDTRESMTEEGNINHGKNKSEAQNETSASESGGAVILNTTAKTAFITTTSADTVKSSTTPTTSSSTMSILVTNAGSTVKMDTTFSTTVSSLTAPSPAEPTTVVAKPTTTPAENATTSGASTTKKPLAPKIPKDSKKRSTTSTTVASTTTHTRKTTTTPLPNQTEIECEKPAYHEFPDDLFSNKQRAQGFVVIHVLVGFYMFYALAVVCDEYFVASMEKICLKMGLSEDVAGATFMAAGSSAPELFASLLGVFVAKGDVGTGTIVGSAVFNILFVIGICGLFAGQVVILNWWPLLRDSLFYSITIAVLIAILADGVVTWWESLIMLLLYAVYILIMKYNLKIHIWLTKNTRLRNMDEFTQSTRGILIHDEKQIRSSYVQFTNDGDVKGQVVSPTQISSQLATDEIIRDFPRKMSLYEAALKVMSSQYFCPLTRFRCAGKRLIVERRHLDQENNRNKSILINDYGNSAAKPTQGWNTGREPNEEWKMPPSVAQNGILNVIKWFITIPVLATLHYTIPDCRSTRWERWYLLTFFTAMLWIAFFSYILVWMVTLVGYTCGVPDTIMGITFLAAGTSIPDAYSSLIVARQGMGDMAVSNSIGSNVFDILIGLALPWFLQTAIVEPNSKVPISSGGMVYNVILLFLSIAATIIGVHYAQWQLSKRLGVTLIIAYVIFLIFSMLIEFNVFGNVNLPECEE